MTKENDTPSWWGHLPFFAFYFCARVPHFSPKQEESRLPPSYSCLPGEGLLELVRVVTDWAEAPGGGARARSSAQAQSGTESPVLGWSLWVA